MRVISTEEIHAMLPWSEAIDLIERVMVRVADGEAILPLRQMVSLGGRNNLGIMPGALGAHDVYGVKLLSLFPDNPSRGLGSHLGVMVLFEPETGQATALLDADALTAIRTAAASAAATRALARPESRVLALIGAGEQARAHAEAICQVRPIREIRICGRRAEAAESLAEKLRQRPDGPLAPVILGGTDVAEAAAGADILCTVTSSASPVIGAAEVGPGTHVNAVGASIPSMQEIGSDLALAARLFVDYRPSALAQAREIIDALQGGLFGEEHILGEIGEVFAGRIAGRSAPDQITLYRSLGIAAQDIASAEHVRRKLEQAGSPPG